MVEPTRRTRAPRAIPSEAPVAADSKRTPEEIQASIEADRLARQLGAEDPVEAAYLADEEDTVAVSAAPVNEAMVDDSVILIHFLEDGFTAAGQVWYRGQELEFDFPSEAYQDTIDKHGQSWLDLSEFEQFKKYGKIFFRRGPWPGEPWQDAETAEFASRLRRAQALPATI